MDAALSELLSLTDFWDEDTTGWVRLDRTEIQGRAIVLSLTVKADQPEIGTTRWRVTAQSVVGYRFQSGEADFDQYGIKLTDHDPILSDYADSYFTLGFLGKPRDATRLCLALLHALHDVAPYRDSRSSVKTDPAFYAVGHGFAGRGPEYLMRACFPVLEAQGMEPYLTRAYNPHEKRVAEATQGGPLRLLSIGDSYVVASQFTAERGATVQDDQGNTP